MTRKRVLISAMMAEDADRELLLGARVSAIAPKDGSLARREVPRGGLAPKVDLTSSNVLACDIHTVHRSRGDRSTHLAVPISTKYAD